MNTIESLANYRSALVIWKKQKRKYDSLKTQRKEMEPEPTPVQFEIPNDNLWAIKVREDVLGKPIIIPQRKI